jgi:ketosteroid isomerase-like protein
MKEYKETWELFFDHSPGGPGAFDVTELRITASETVAYCHVLVEIVDSKVRVTIGLHKERGQWLIAHEHHSYPLSSNQRNKDTPGARLCEACAAGVMASRWHPHHPSRT